MNHRIQNWNCAISFRLSDVRVVACLICESVHFASVVLYACENNFMLVRRDFADADAFRLLLLIFHDIHSLKMYVCAA